jgi:hypothetical protein
LEVLPHAAPHHEVKEFTVVHHLSILTSGGIHPPALRKRGLITAMLVEM